MHPDVDELALAGALPLDQRQQEAHETEAGGRLVTLVAARPDRRDGVVVVAAAVQRAAEGQADQVAADPCPPTGRPGRTGSRRARSGRAMPARTSVDGDAELSAIPAGRKVVMAMSARRSRPRSCALPVGGPVVDHRAALVGVVVPEGEAVVGVDLSRGRTGRPMRVGEPSGRLDLDHVGAHSRPAACRPSRRPGRRPARPPETVEQRSAPAIRSPPDACELVVLVVGHAEELLEHVLVVLAEQRARAPVVLAHARRTGSGCPRTGLGRSPDGPSRRTPRGGATCGSRSLRSSAFCTAPAGTPAACSSLHHLVAVRSPVHAADRSSSASWLAKRDVLGGEARRPRSRRPPDRVDEARPLLVVEHGDRDPAVLAAAG